MLTSNLPKTFAESVNIAEEYALLQLEESSCQQLLHYHNEDHANAVKRRARLIFEAIAPFLSLNEIALQRTQLLIDFCATAHDMVQIFSEHLPDTSRKRPHGVSEAETITQLIAYIQELNQQILQHNPSSEAVFTDSDIEIIREAIEATVCEYNVGDRSLYQPSLYQTDKSPNIVALVTALADLGALGIEGIDAYNQEGRLISLEENPDAISIIKIQPCMNIEVFDQLEQRREDIRQRLLKRANFQVDFAKGRLKRFEREVSRLPEGAIHQLKTQVFKHLTSETIEAIELTTPTKDDTSLWELAAFFGLGDQLSPIQFKLEQNEPW
ncbi:MAG: hypothetical protein HC879_10745 [Leptolyngbyaceae cyanobacterium SL_5_9]|nr:hypothetical protein [Leptolyngbyaceae cyanobacterium SL_5_9]